MSDTVRTTAALTALLSDGAAAHSTNRQLLRDWLVSIPSMFGVVSVQEVRFAGGAVGDGTTDDSAAINAALATGNNVFFPWTATGYKANNLTQSANEQIIFAHSPVRITKNANGVLFTSTGQNVQLRNLMFRGESSTPAFTGDNVNFSGPNCSMVNCGSRYAFGRAVKATSDAFAIIGQSDIYQTADASASGYDIEIGVSGTATLYHRIMGVVSTQNTGGILATDTGSLLLGYSQFGKLYIKKGTGPAGVNGGCTNNCRILGAITVEASDALFSNNAFGNVAITLGTGTTGISIAESNSFSAGTTITNNGNATANLIRRRVSTGASNTVQIQVGDDTVFCLVEYTLGAAGAGTFKAPQMRILNNKNYIWEQATTPGTVGATMGLSSADDMALTNLVTGRAITYTTTGTASGSRHQFVVGTTVRAFIDNSGFHPVSQTNGSQWIQGEASELLTLSTVAGFTDTTANLLPANSIIEAVVARVTTAITVATDWKLGDATVAGRFSAANAVMTLGSTTIGTVHVDQTGTSGPRQTAAAKVRVTTTGTPGAGAVRITVYYRTFVAPTS